MAARKVSRRLVVDASVYRSAGPEGAEFPLSKNCRDLLLAIHRICHRVVLTDDMRAEFRRHRSSFSHKWLTAMYARKKVEDLDAVPNPRLRDAIAAMDVTAKAIEAMRKDVHLLEAALASDQTVISLDETVRALFTRLTAHAADVAPVIWVNPGRGDDDALPWLEDGAPPDVPRRLGGLPPASRRRGLRGSI